MHDISELASFPAPGLITKLTTLSWLPALLTHEIKMQLWSTSFVMRILQNGYTNMDNRRNSRGWLIRKQLSITGAEWLPHMQQLPVCPARPLQSPLPCTDIRPYVNTVCRISSYGRRSTERPWWYFSSGSKKGCKERHSRRWQQWAQLCCWTRWATCSFAYWIWAIVQLAHQVKLLLPCQSTGL